jgi:hypothetical protein
MRKFDYSVDTSPKVIQPGWSIKQFVVDNSSPYPLYINASGSVPTSSSFEYIVQPNSTYVSVEINASILTLSTELVSQKIIKITVMDEVARVAANIPYADYQFVSSYPGYPYTITSPSQLMMLPPIFVDSFKNIYCNLIRTVGAPNSNSDLALVMSGNFVGFFNPGGGVITFTPPLANRFYNPQLIQYADVISGGEFILDFVSGAENINESIPKSSVARNISLLSTESFYSGVYAGFFLYEVYVYGTPGETVSFTITISTSDNIGGFVSAAVIAQFTSSLIIPAGGAAYLLNTQYASVGHDCAVQIDCRFDAHIGSNTVAVAANALSL